MKSCAIQNIEPKVGPFIRFALVSGTGWLCDLIIFTFLLRTIRISAAAANVFSSYVGLTFVYYTSLRVVFHKQDKTNRQFLYIYWVFQYCAIGTYSMAVGYVARLLVGSEFLHVDSKLAGIGAKILVTPVSLCTNFLFMKFLSHFMKQFAQSRKHLVEQTAAKR